MTLSHCHNGLLSVRAQGTTHFTSWEPLWLLLPTQRPRDCDPGTQGFSNVSPRQRPWRPADPPHPAGNQHRPAACRTEGQVVSGSPGRSHSELVLPLARSQLHGESILETHNSTNSMPLRTQDSTLTLLSCYLCSQLCPPPSGRIPEREENKSNLWQPAEHFKACE